MRKFFENLELILTAAGLLVIFAVHWIFQQSEHPWALTAATAIAVGVLHGVIFWIVRTRQRRIRQRTLEDAERMLKDIVNNQLCVIIFAADMHKKDQMPFKTAHAHITSSVTAIHGMLDNLSEESLNLWKLKYKRGLPPEPSGSN
ncbi:hypothetical protein [Rariglobus hedericola]|uniref:Uncharacterized protein n=1 Tax=Rariglobus hedericola TaxID=2597822 RepID=A0A556QKF9_9BACT|nr:hypothetical protein [Rariglobus hedericola]TSJ77134.1 hypothetical protein FPL22_13610 [Rariglobus hedericola]